MDKKRWFVLFLVVMFLMACASAVPISPDRDANPPKVEVPITKDKTIVDKPVSDTDLFHGAVSYLGNPEVTADYVRARLVFELLVKIYPESKWRNLSETFIRIIDDMQACKVKSSSDQLLLDKAQADKGRLFQENEQLKKDTEQLKKENEQLKKDTEQLKKDIQLLKNLEIQLEKREKILR